jgi:DNA-directed RNA polymerase subunit RPC12/RpoP
MMNRSGGLLAASRDRASWLSPLTDELLVGETSMAGTDEAPFSPVSEFKQTCGFCGCEFRVEIERAVSFKDTQDYRCPECRTLCKVRTSTTPRVTLLRRRSDRRTSLHPDS